MITIQASRNCLGAGSGFRVIWLTALPQVCLGPGDLPTPPPSAGPSVTSCDPRRCTVGRVSYLWLSLLNSMMYPHFTLIRHYQLHDHQSLSLLEHIPASSTQVIGGGVGKEQKHTLFRFPVDLEIREADTQVGRTRGVPCIHSSSHCAPHMWQALRKVLEIQQETKPLPS